MLTPLFIFLLRRVSTIANCFISINNKFTDILIRLPHIVFDKKIDLDDYSKKFESIFQKDPFLIRISNIFVDKDNLTALLPSVVISELNQQFLIEISTSKSKTTIRLYPGTDPEKTSGVKRSMALLAKQIVERYPDFHITKTNLDEYVKSVFEK